MHTYLNAVRSHLTFYGRTSRTDFWLAHIVLLPTLFFTLLNVGTYVGGRSIWPSVPFLLLVVPWAALVVRRLHDMDRLGW